MGVMNAMNVEASCAICGAPSSIPECPHESQRLKMALDQAQARWEGIQTIRDWVVLHARNAVISTFQQLKASRWEQSVAYLQSLPCYTIYTRFHGDPPLPLQQKQFLHAQVARVHEAFRVGVDEDWRRSCMRYPQVLDYYFSLVEWDLPDNNDPVMRNPRFGAAVGSDVGRLKSRRESVDGSSAKEHRKKHRRRSRGMTPPAAPMTRDFR